MRTGLIELFARRNENIEFFVKRDGLEFRVNVKAFWISFVTREKAKYFYVTEFYKGE